MELEDSSPHLVPSYWFPGDPKMRKIWVERLATFLFTACCLVSFTCSVNASKDNLPRWPGTALLVGHYPDGLAVTVGEITTQIQGGGEWEVIPSISADGRKVASARLIPENSLEATPTFIVGTYDMTDNRWTDYNQLQIKGGSIAISPDGSKLACSNMAVGPSLLHILDVKTGKISVGPEVTKSDGSLTWSPDGRRIAFVKGLEGGGDGVLTSLLPEIYIFNVEDGTVSKIAEGAAPSWSPSGEWIAFSDYSAFRHGRYANTAYRLSLIHPDGKGSVELLKQGKDLFLPAIWSPDSKSLLLQRPEEDDVNPRVNLYVLNLATLQLTVKFRKTPEVHGWANAR
jgi:dipeptidyl aminopeptidase/acylaminoacyl peptidase